jgi:hypothetical protein
MFKRCDTTDSFSIGFMEHVEYTITPPTLKEVEGRKRVEGRELKERKLRKGS